MGLPMHARRCMALHGGQLGPLAMRASSLTRCHQKVGHHFGALAGGFWLSALEVGSGLERIVPDWMSTLNR